MFDLRAKRELNRGFSDGLSRGIEVIVAPLLLGTLGLWLDGLVGTRPVLAIAFGAFGAAGVFTKLWLGYDRQMRIEDHGKPWSRPVRTSPGEGPIS